MNHYHLISLIVIWLANVHQPFVNCDENELQVRLKMLFKQYEEWFVMPDVSCKLETGVEGKFIILSTNQLFAPLQPGEDIHVKYVIAASLLGCECVNILSKYLFYIQNFFLYFKIHLQMHKNHLEKTYVYAHISMIKNIASMSVILEKMRDALNYMKQLNPVVEPYIKVFVEFVNRLLSFALNPAYNKKQEHFFETNGAIKSDLINADQHAIFLIMAENKKALSFFAEKKCILQENAPISDKAPEEMLKYIKSQLDEIRHDVLEKYFRRHGFSYSRETRSITDKALTSPFHKHNTEQLLAVRLHSLLTGYSGWCQFTQMRGTIETSVDHTIEFSSQDLYDLLHKHKIPINEVTAEDIYLKTATLLGCKYMDLLLKYVNLLRQNLWHCEKIVKEGATHADQNLMLCFKQLLTNAKGSVFMFEYMYSALRSFEEMYPIHDAYFKDFSDKVLRISTFCENGIVDFLRKTLDPKVNADVTVVKNEIKALSSYFVSILVIIKGVSDTRCELEGDNLPSHEKFQNYVNAQPENAKLPILEFIGSLVRQIGNQVVYTYFKHLGFEYDKTSKKAIVPIISPLIDVRENIPVPSDEPRDVTESIPMPSEEPQGLSESMPTIRAQPPSTQDAVYLVDNKENVKRSLHLLNLSLGTKKNIYTADVTDDTKDNIKLAGFGPLDRKKDIYSADVPTDNKDNVRLIGKQSRGKKRPMSPMDDDDEFIDSKDNVQLLSEHLLGKKRTGIPDIDDEMYTEEKPKPKRKPRTPKEPKDPNKPNPPKKQRSIKVKKENLFD